MSNTPQRRTSTRILFGMIGGLILGLLIPLLPGNWPANIIQYALRPLGDLFLRSLFMVVVPLVFASLVVGVGRLGSVNKLGRIGTKLAVYYLLTSLAAVIIGQLLVSVIRPGEGLSMELVEAVRLKSADQVASLMEKSSSVGSSLWPGIVNAIVPKNVFESFSQGNMLSIIFAAVLFGAALLKMNNEASNTTLKVAEGVTNATVTIVGWIMRLAPFAVAALMAIAVAQFGLELLRSLGVYVSVVVAGYLIHIFVVYHFFVRTVLRYPFGTFLRKMTPVFITAFSTSSSSATMPTTIRTAVEDFGVKQETASFSIPLGTTVNMDGTALFECIAALFVAQVFGVDIGLTGQITLVMLIVLTSIGVAGVPGGSIPILMSAMAMLGIPPEGIALVLGVDRLLDMGRTVLNVTGDMCGSLYLSKSEGHEILT